VILGAFTHRTALAPVADSGKEVTAANTTKPIQVRPKPVFSARTSPYFDNRLPEKVITAVKRANWSQTFHHVKI
jgi:hypothetical protein